MWSRVVEIMLGCWLLISPFIFGHPADKPSWWYWDMGSGMLVIVLALLTWIPMTRRAHLGTAVWSVVLAGSAFARGWGNEAVPPAVQNDLTIGLMLLMLAVIPSMATQPPAAWRMTPVGAGGQWSSEGRSD